MQINNISECFGAASKCSASTLMPVKVLLITNTGFGADPEESQGT